MRARRDETGPAALARNYLPGCLLLLVAESPSHGYELLDRVADLGVLGVDSSTLYRVLRGLNSEGLVESRWESSSTGPARRTYRLTDEGARHLDEWAGTVTATSGYLCSFLSRHRRLDGWSRQSDEGLALAPDEGAA